MTVPFPKIWINKKPLHRRGRIYTVRLYEFSHDRNKVTRVRDSNGNFVCAYTQSVRHATSLRNDLLDQYPNACVAVTYSVKLFGNLCDTLMALIVNDGTFEKRYRVRYHILTLQTETVDYATAAYHALENTGYHLEANGVAAKYTLSEDIGTSRMSVNTGDRDQEQYDDDDDEQPIDQYDSDDCANDREFWT